MSGSSYCTFDARIAVSSVEVRLCRKSVLAGSERESLHQGIGRVSGNIRQKCYLGNLQTFPRQEKGHLHKSIHQILAKVPLA
jgi:hypothetical protein